jgi:hypothetical protein
MKGWKSSRMGRSRPRAGIVPFVLVLLAVVAAAGGIAYAFIPAGANPDLSKMLSKLDCRIKGNVSQNTGERIYHVPGQEYYSETVVRTEYGERWFCSEEDARSAGWRRSKV